MRTLSSDLRNRILIAYDSCEYTREEIADIFIVSLGMVKKLIQQRKTLGHIENLHCRAGRHRILTPEHEARLKELLAKDPSMTVEELRGALGTECSWMTVDRALKRLGWTYKKRVFTPANRSART